MADKLAIDVRGMTKRFGSRTVVNQIDLQVRRGEIFGFLGPNGSGKSTLLNLIAGLERPTRGAVTVDGRNLAAMTDTEATVFRRDVIGVVFQFFNLLPTLSVAENIALPARLAGTTEGLDARVAELVARVGLEHRQGHARLYVEDTGIGIAAEHFPHIFDRFYRVDSARPRHSSATGLGLAICQSIAVAHQGDLEIESQPGRGTRMTVVLPATLVEAERRPAVAGPSPIL